MGKIFAVGGGEVTPHLDQVFVSLCEKENPKLLFLGTASHDNLDYFHSVKVRFESLGCEVDTVHTVDYVNVNQIRSKIFSADCIYVGGGDTAFLMDCWHRLGIDEMLKTAFERGIVLGGISAGGICWFDRGYSDSAGDKMDFVKGIGLIHKDFCPHYDTEAYSTFPSADGIALKNGCAVLWNGETFTYFEEKSHL